MFEVHRANLGVFRCVRVAMGEREWVKVERAGEKRRWADAMFQPRV
jgi:hypothetical protein